MLRLFNHGIGALPEDLPESIVSYRGIVKCTVLKSSRCLWGGLYKGAGGGSLPDGLLG
jgi:uncharacterized membrane protein